MVLEVERYALAHEDGTTVIIDECTGKIEDGRIEVSKEDVGND